MTLPAMGKHLRGLVRSKPVPAHSRRNTSSPSQGTVVSAHVTKWADRLRDCLAPQLCILGWTLRVPEAKCPDLVPSEITQGCLKSVAWVWGQEGRVTQQAESLWRPGS